MIRILCYGDSNTCGTTPSTWGERYDENTRWTRLLQKQLGNKFEVIEEGFRGRNTAIDDIKFPRGNRNGAVVFSQCVLSHDPLDYIVIMLGLNDMKEEFNLSPKDSAANIQKYYIEHLREKLSIDLVKVPKVIIVAPNIMNDVVDKFKGAALKSQAFNKEYKKMALKTKCLFVDNSGLSAGNDGIHFTKEAHKLLAEKLTKLILENEK